MLMVNFKKAVSIKLTAFLAFSIFCEQAYKASKKSVDFLERGKTYVVYLQNFVLFYTEYVLTRYSKCSQENEIQNLSQQPLTSSTVSVFSSTSLFFLLCT